MTQKLRKLYYVLWLIAPVAVWFSYYPNIHFGQDETMNFEVSLPLMLLAALGLVSVPRIMTGWRDVVTNRYVWVVAALCVYSVATIVWSANPTRGLLTGGIIGLLYLVFLGAVAERKRLLKLLPRLTKIYVITALVMSGLALVQFVLGVWAPQDAALLCNGCVPQQFGFPRANVFAIEPQFFANMLLPALFVLLHRLLGGTAKRVEYAGLGLLLVALLLTMSRGAIFALIVGGIILLTIHYKRLGRLLRVAGVSLLALVVALVMQGTAATLSPQVSETFMGAVVKSINQLSMGVVDISTTKSEAPTGPEEGKDVPVFDGYVEESTNIRMGRSEMAIATWGRDVPTMLFGVGVGGAGVAVQQEFPEQTGAREIVQNEFVERLLERGVIGLALTLVAIGALLYMLRNHKWLWAIIVGFLFQYLLFSGYPNAIHIYLVLILLCVIGLSDTRRLRYL